MLFLWLVLVCGASWALGWVVIAYQWFWDAAVVLKGMPGCVGTVQIAVLVMKCIWYLSAHIHSFFGRSKVTFLALLCVTCGGFSVRRTR